MADVLILEDEESLLQTLRYNLSRAGHAVRMCTDGAKGLEMVRENPPDLLLLDLMLPGMDASRSAVRCGATRPIRRSVTCQSWCSPRATKRSTRWSGSKWGPTTT